ncbi:MAG: hypothetical protein F4204_07255 [Rhodospirillaceae bacterium]|nr:hypothetical protein [Rhodospirillaceae bacterium]MXW91378.1 hypothetical protein [Rhodospirillaceae bacterium]MYB12670.1 hypothetical protein [Rhodospirillaceae bacterium]MYG52141.1 hypothetical protein [Rhodospirillaceae bacterium]MYI50324.1 hypothetical protein [Rhodospirillaceae bacterium]
MDANLAGLVALGALIIGLFAWLRQDIRTLRDEVRNEISGLRGEMNELRDRVARIEGLLEAVFMRRDLTPLPDPPLPGGPSPTSEAA